MKQSVARKCELFPKDPEVWRPKAPWCKQWNVATEKGKWGTFLAVAVEHHWTDAWPKSRVFIEKKLRADWKNRVSVTRWRHRTSTHAVDVMMARAKRFYILIIKVNKLFSLSHSISRSPKLQLVFLENIIPLNVYNERESINEDRHNQRVQTFSHLFKHQKGQTSLVLISRRGIDLPSGLIR